MKDQSINARVCGGKVSSGSRFQSGSIDGACVPCRGGVRECTVVGIVICMMSDSCDGQVLAQQEPCAGMLYTCLEHVRHVVLHVLSGGGIRSAPTHAQSEILPLASLLPHTVAAESGEVPTYLGGR